MFCIDGIKFVFVVLSIVARNKKIDVWMDGFLSCGSLVKPFSHLVSRLSLATPAEEIPYGELTFKLVKALAK